MNTKVFIVSTKEKNNMSYAIVYSSKTGNTELLASTIKDTLPHGECIYFGNPNPAALKADTIYLGFWTDKGNCNKETSEFLNMLTNKKVFLFGTAGFGEDESYFDKILERVSEQMSKDITLIGSYMCQGRMPMAVRTRYEKMKDSPNAMPHLDQMIENFDKALSHPDAQDLANLKSSLK